MTLRSPRFGLRSPKVPPSCTPAQENREWTLSGPGRVLHHVRYYERFPPSSSSALKLTDTKWTENAQVRRSARAGPSDRNPPIFIKLSKEEQTLDCMRNQHCKKKPLTSWHQMAPQWCQSGAIWYVAPDSSLSPGPPDAPLWCHTRATILAPYGRMALQWCQSGAIW